MYDSWWRNEQFNLVCNTYRVIVQNLIEKTQLLEWTLVSERAKSTWCIGWKNLLFFLSVSVKWKTQKNKTDSLNVVVWIFSPVKNFCFLFGFISFQKSTELWKWKYGNEKKKKPSKSKKSFGYKFCKIKLNKIT